MKGLKKSFLKKKKTLLATSFFLAVFIPILVGYLIWQRDYRAIATVNGEKILESDLDRAKLVAEKTAVYMGGDKSGAEEQAKADLIHRKILDMAAKEAKVNVSDDEVRARIDEIAKSFDNDANALFDLYGRSYGYQRNELEEAVSYEILKEKLEPRILKYKSGRYVYARYASGNDSADAENIDGLPMADWAKMKIEGFEKQLADGMKFDDIYAQATNDVKYTYPLLYGTEFEKINSETADISIQEKEAVLGTAKGKHSKMVKGDSVYAIYNVEKEGVGKYDSWDGFFKDYEGRYVRYGFVTQGQINRMASVYNQLVTAVNQTFGVKITQAKCSLCDNCHGATVKGVVSDALTGVKIPGVAVKIWTSSQGTQCSSYSDPAGRCGPKSGTDTTDANGYYQFGRTDRLGCFVNCAYVLNKYNQKVYGWYIEASKSGYQSFAPKEVFPTNGNILSFNIKLALSKNNAILNVVRKGLGSGRVESVPVSQGIDCGSDCIQDFDRSKKTKVVLKATADPGSVFTGWSSSSCAGTGACSVVMDGDKTVYATFNLSNVPVGMGSCNVAVSPTSGEHPLAVDIAVSWNPPENFNYHSHSYSCGTATNPKTCSYWEWEWAYTPTPTWYKVYWEAVKADGTVTEIGIIQEAGNPSSTVGITAPSKFSFTFPKALPAGESYTVKADFDYYAKGTHGPSQVVKTPVCDLVSGIKSRDPRDSNGHEVAP